MTDGGSIVTLTYYGAEKVVPRYNVMGVAKAALEASVRYLAYDLGKNNIRVNAISAGPMKTLAARGIGSLGEMMKSQAEKSPLQRNIDVNEVAATAVFLASEGATGITGETHLRRLRLQHHGVLRAPEDWLHLPESFSSGNQLLSLSSNHAPL